MEFKENNTGLSTHNMSIILTIQIHHTEKKEDIEQLYPVLKDKE